jgi:hypothetical protein
MNSSSTGASGGRAQAIRGAVDLALERGRGSEPCQHIANRRTHYHIVLRTRIAHRKTRDSDAQDPG